MVALFPLKGRSALMLMPEGGTGTPEPVEWLWPSIIFRLALTFVAQSGPGSTDGLGIGMPIFGEVVVFAKELIL